MNDFAVVCREGIGEGNGNPLQCSCLESPRDGGAWWAAVCGRTESDTTEATQQQQQQGRKQFCLVIVVNVEVRGSLAPSCTGGGTEAPNMDVSQLHSKL